MKYSGTAGVARVLMPTHRSPAAGVALDRRAPGPSHGPGSPAQLSVLVWCLRAGGTKPACRAGRRGAQVEHVVEVRNAVRVRAIDCIGVAPENDAVRANRPGGDGGH